jgi:nascent polypeptide-associated complex subunit alpha
VIPKIQDDLLGDSTNPFQSLIFAYFKTFNWWISITQTGTMIPGMGHVNPRQVKQAMKRLGIKTEDIENVEEVIIRTRSKEYVFKDAAVTMMEMQGQKTFQVVGEPQVSDISDRPAKPEESRIPEEDVKLVRDQTGCSEERAIKALKECGGQPAEAILKIMSS